MLTMGVPSSLFAKIAKDLIGSGDDFLSMRSLAAAPMTPKDGNDGSLIWRFFRISLDLPILKICLKSVKLKNFCGNL